jgi:hypothetical protein
MLSAAIRQPLALLLTLLAGVGVTACARTQIREGQVLKRDTAYRFGEPPEGWRKLQVNDNDVAFQSEHSPHVVAVNATCKEYEDVQLPVLTRHLLMGFTDTDIHEQTAEPLDGREALRTHVTARLDGVPTELLLVVLKKDGCIYDFSYLSPVGQLEEERPAFETLVHNFSASVRP